MFRQYEIDGKIITSLMVEKCRIKGGDAKKIPQQNIKDITEKEVVK